MNTWTNHCAKLSLKSSANFGSRFWKTGNWKAGFIEIWVCSWCLWVNPVQKPRSNWTTKNYGSFCATSESRFWTFPTGHEGYIFRDISVNTNASTLRFGEPVMILLLSLRFQFYRRWFVIFFRKTTKTHRKGQVGTSPISKSSINWSDFEKTTRVASIILKSPLVDIILYTKPGVWRDIMSFRTCRLDFVSFKKHFFMTKKVEIQNFQQVWSFLAMRLHSHVINRISEVQSVHVPRRSTYFQFARKSLSNRDFCPQKGCKKVF